MRNKRPLGIYLHIPFCVRKCDYCDFLSAPASIEVQRRYVSCLKEEILRFGEAGKYEVQSVFFGGGTPSILEGTQISELMDALYRIFAFAERPECTVECNPGTLNLEKLEWYRESGINRLSIGLQSADDRELKLLGRIHTWEDFCRNFEQARRIGFSNINVDLMSALPGQTAASWKNTVEKVLSYDPEHISAYSLMIEEGTPFFERYGQEAAARERGEEVFHLPSEEEEREMYYDTQRMLSEAGLHRYEISNYAKDGFESRHNSGYWKRQEYAGFGLGASSQLDRLRYKKTDRLEEYLEGDYSEKDVLELTRRDEIEETMYLGLRMTEGVSLAQFREKFGVTAEHIYGDVIKKLERQGLIRTENEYICLTALGMDVSNRVLAEFLL